jgi:hypothetical protein
MELKELKPRKALNKAFLKVKPNRTEIEGFKTNLIQLEIPVKLTTYFRFSLTTHFRFKLTTLIRAKLTTCFRSKLTT